MDLLYPKAKSTAEILTEILQRLEALENKAPKK